MLMERAMAWAEEIAACAPLSVRATKEVAMESLGYPLEEALRCSYDGISQAVHVGRLHRRPARIRREAQAELEGALTTGPQR